MPIMFNTLLNDAGLPLSDVCLLRHQDNRADLGRNPYELWRDDRTAFDLYQSHQRIDARQKFTRPFWASFVGTPDHETLFVGIYAATYRGLLDRDIPQPHRQAVDKVGGCDVYDLSLEAALGDLSGRLYVEWGEGFRAWVQHADKQNKPIRELRTAFKEPDFPGFLNFVKLPSELPKLPAAWIAAFRASKGIYLLTCPKTREQYVGSATGEGGFWGRWQDYVRTGHGGNVLLKSRDPSDYQVAILEVAGTACTDSDILIMEQRWKAKLQSREMGLNRN
jgi:hypothetical protein